ncbi:MAG: hypothetical protein JST04_13335 [Bdellovibrionales bacterium]|nr:hypothetical protein [Bdellovibrionales bacterium]
MNSSTAPRFGKFFACARALVGIASAVALSSCGTQINTLSKVGKAGFGAAGVPPGITSLTITDSTPTNHRPLALHWGLAVGDVSEYCLLENSTDVNACIWHSGALPTTYLDSASDGPFVLSAYVKNTYGISDRVDSNSVDIDHTPPVIASAAVTNASPSHDPNFALSYGAVTGTYASYCINENNSAVVGCSWIAGALPSSKLMIGADGSKVLTVWLRDAAGNVSAPVDTAPVVLDTAAPTLSIASPAPGSTMNGANASAFVVSGGCSENGRGVAITGDASAIVTCTGGAWTATLDFSAAPQGAISISVDHADAAGNSAPTVSRSFTKDTVAPTVAITSPAAGTTINAGNQASFAVSGTCSENGRNVVLSGAASGTVTCSGGTWSANLNFSAAADGSVTLYADHSDAAGNNAAQASRTFNKDATPPTVAITSPAAGAYVNNANKTAFAVSGTCSENGQNVVLSGAGSATVACVGGTWSTNLDVSGAADGTITVYADHADASGNPATQASRAFNKDTVNPSVTISSPVAGTLIGSATQASFAISGSCSENGRSVSLSGSATGSATCTAGAWSTTLDFTAAADGPVTVYADLGDVAGNSAAQASRAFVKDATAPIVTINSPGAGSYVNLANQAAFVLSGTCSEDGQNVVIGGAASATVVCSSGSWTKTFDLTAAAQGAVAFTADHSDAAGNAATQASRAFVKDTVVPTVTVVNPAAGTLVSGANVTSFAVSGACSENGLNVAISGSATATVACSGGAWTANLDFSAAADGPVSITVNHSDAAGNAASPDTRSFQKDATPAAVAFTLPAAGAYVNLANRASFAVSGTCSDSGQNVVLSGAASATVTCTAGGWSANLNLTAAADGAITLYADHSDAGGNAAPQASRSFTKDTVAPSLLITSPVAGSSIYTVNMTTFAVSGSCSENGQTITFSGGATGTTTCSGGSWSANLDFSGASDGAVTLYADMADAAGNPATQASRSFNKDTGVPTLTIDSPVAGSYVNLANQTSFTVSGTCSENGQNVVLTGSVSASVACSGGAWSKAFDYSGVADGAISVTANHSDTAGNAANPQTRAFAKDTVNPVVSEGNPAAGTVIAGGSTYNITWTATDTNAVASISLYYSTNSGSNWTQFQSGLPNSGTFAWTVPSLDNTTMRIRVRVYDVAGNTDYDSNNDFTIDSTAPSITINSPAVNSYVNNASKTSFTIGGTCSENGQTVTISGAGSGTTTCTAGNWSKAVDVSGAADGSITLYADLADAAGNAAPQASRTFIKDVVAPTAPNAIALVTPATSPGTNATPTIRIGGLVSGDTIKLFSDACTTQVASGTAAGVNLNLVSSSLADGSYTFYANSTDAAGNISSCSTATVAYVLDTTAPSVAITAPAANSYINLANFSSFSVSGTCSEPGRTVSVSAAAGAVTAAPVCAGGNTWATSLAFANEIQSSWTPQYSSIVAYWKLNGTGSVSNGASVPAQIGPNGSAVGSAMTYGSARLGNGLVMDGYVSQNYVDVGTPAALTGLTRVTVAAWVKHDNDPDYADVAGKEGSFKLNLNAHKYSFHISTNGTNWDCHADGGTVTTPGVWYHVVGTYDGTDAKLYLNGVPEATCAFSGNLAANSRHFAIGAFDDGGSFGDFWPGSLDEVAVWNRALTAGEVSTLYASQSGAVVSDGTISVLADHSDAAGNAAPQDSRTFNKDTVAPSAATALGWSATSPSGTTALTASWTKSAAGDLANQKIQFYSDAGCATPSGGLVDLTSASAQTASFTAPSDGTYAYILTSFDAAGNSTAAACSTPMVVDTAPPSVAITSPAANSYLTRSNIASFAVGGTCSENGFPVVASGAGGLALGTATCAAGNWSTNLNFNPEFDSVTAPKWSNMIAYWKLNNAWTDSKNTYNGSSVNGATFTTNSRIGSHAASFDGVDDYADFGSIAAMNFGTGSFTISTWIKTDSSAQLGSIFNVRGASILSLSTSQGDSFNPTSGKKITFLAYKDGSHYRGGYATADVIDGNWHHVVWVANATANTNAIYIDGASVAVTMDNVAGTWPNLSGTNYTSLGRDYDYGFNFRGSIDETMVWNAALSAHDVANLYSRRGYEYGSGSPDFANLRGQWKLNAPVASIPNDAIVPATFGQNAVAKNANGTGMAYVASPIGTALSLDGVDDHLEINGHNYNFGTGAFTISLWFNKISSVSRGDLFTWKDASHDTGIFMDGNILTVFVAGGGAITGAALSTGEWHHVIYTRDGSSNVAVYVDGASYASTTSSADISGYSNVPIWIGSNHDVFNAVESPFDGAIDDVVITNTVASLADAQAIYAGAALNEGNFTVLADHADAAGNRAPTDSRTFVRDYVAPTVAITSPAAGSYVTNATKSAFVISGTCSADTASLALSGTGYAGSNPTCSSGSWTATMDVSGAPDGAVSYTIVATDAGGNSTSDVRAFVKDVGVPTVAITLPSAGSWVNNAAKAAFTVSGTCSENGLNVVLSGAGSGTVACSGGTWSKALDVSAAADGSITITANHSDAAGNAATADSRNFNKDVVSPTVAILTPNGGETLRGGATYNITWNASDANGVVNVGLRYSTDGFSTFTAIASGLSNTGTYAWTVPSINSATVLVKAIGVNDPAGNGSMDGSDSVFTIDSTAPAAATSLGWSSSNPHTSTSVTASWTKSVSADLANQNIQFYADGTCTTASGSAIAVSPGTGQAYAWTAPGDGTFTYKISSLDAAGNAMNSGCSSAMVVDSTPPNAATGIGWVETSPRIGTALNAAWTKSNSADLANQTLQFYSDSTCTTTSGSSIDLSSASLQTKAWTAPGSGYYTYKVTSIDNAGLSTVSACSAAMRVQFPTFTDNFDDNQINAGVWDVCSVSGMKPTASCTSNITISETGGKARITMPTAAQGGWVWNGFTTIGRYDLTDSYVQVAMTSAFASTTGNTEACLYLDFNGGSYVGICKEGSGFYIESTGLYQLIGTYNATNHKYFRFRHDASSGNIYYEYSADALTWTVAYSGAKPGGYDLTNARLSVMGQRNNSTEGAVQTTDFDDFATSGRNLQPATFSDGFTDNTVGSDWTTCSTSGTWVDMLYNCTAAGKAKITISESGGQAVVNMAAGGTGAWEHNGYATSTMFDFTDSYVQVEMPSAPPNGNGHFGAGLLIDFGINLGDGILFYKFNTVVSSEWAHTGSYSSNADFTYNSTNHRWLRVRHASYPNKIYFETSTDGSTWVTQSSFTPNAAWDLKQAVFTLVGEYDPTGPASATNAKFDNFSTNAVRLDDFGDATRGGGWKLISDAGTYLPGGDPDPAITVTEASGVLSVGEPVNESRLNGYETNQALDLTGAFTSVKIDTFPAYTGTRYREAGLWIANSSGDGWEMFASGTYSLHMLSFSSGFVADDVSIALDTTNHKYIRIRHDVNADTMNFETSPDGVTWTSRRSMARAFPITNMHFTIYGYGANGADGPSGSPTCKLDNFATNARNIVP